MLAELPPLPPRSGAGVRTPYCRPEPGSLPEAAPSMTKIVTGHKLSAFCCACCSGPCIVFGARQNHTFETILVDVRQSITIGRPEAASTCFGPFGFAGVADTVVGGLACVQGCETQSPSPHSATLICTGDKQMLLNDKVPILRKTLFEAAPWQGLFLLVLMCLDRDILILRIWGYCIHNIDLYGYMLVCAFAGVASLGVALAGLGCAWPGIFSGSRAIV